MSNGITMKDVVNELLNGLLPGLAITVIGHPFDTLKTRMQVQNHGFRQILSDLVLKEGVLSLYKGVLSPLFSNSLLNMGVFCVYGLSLEVLHDREWSKNS